MEQSNKTTEAILYTLLYVAIFMLSIFIPFFIIIGFVIMPIPIIVFTARHNIKNGLFISMILAIFSFLIGSYVALSITIVMVLGALMIGHMIYKQGSAYETLLYGTVGYAIGLVFAYAVSHIFLQMNWLDLFTESLDESIETFTVFVKQVGLDTNIEAQIEMIEKQILQLTYSFTAILIMIATVLSFITQWLAYKWINWRHKGAYYFPPFRTFNVPVVLIWIHLLAIIFQYTSLEEGSLPYIAAINIFAITTLCIIIQGFSFIFYFAYAKKIHIVFPIIIVVLSIIFAPIFLIFIRFIGIIDIGFRWKSRIQPK